MLTSGIDGAYAENALHSMVLSHGSPGWWMKSLMAFVWRVIVVVSVDYDAMTGVTKLISDAVPTMNPNAVRSHIFLLLIGCLSWVNENSSIFILS